MDHPEETRNEETPDIKETARKLKENVKDFARQGARLTRERCRRAAGSATLKRGSGCHCGCICDLSFSGKAALPVIRTAYVLSLVLSAMLCWRLVRLGLHGRGLGTVVYGLLLFSFLVFSARALAEVAAAIVRMAAARAESAPPMDAAEASASVIDNP